MDKIVGISNSSPAPEPRKLERSKNDLFKQSLEAVRARKTAEPGPTQAVGSLGEVRPTTFPQIQALSHADMVQNTDRILNLLDSYLKDIENPNKTLKDIEPLIDAIQKDALQLLKDSDIVLPEDEDFKRIARETAIAANVEYIKFYRGDYI